MKTDLDRDRDLGGFTGRGIRGRQMARWMFVVAIVPFVLVGLLFATAPNMIGPMITEPPSSWVSIALVGIGIAMAIIGFVWMVRIYRANPEAHPSSWRFRQP